MLEKADGLGLDKLANHVAEHGADGVEALIGVADVGKAGLVQQDLLDDEDSHSL